MNKAYHVGKHDIYLRIKTVSLHEMYGSHRCVSADLGVGFEIVSSYTIQRHVPHDLNPIFCKLFISPATEDCSMDQRV
jgi:hypothetical protein